MKLEIPEEWLVRKLKQRDDLNAAIMGGDDYSVLMERLKEERERVALWLIKCGHPKPVIDAIRSMT